VPPGTRDALLDAALALLDAGGAAAVTLREVGTRAGVSHNAPYKHFANKEALLGAVAARELRRQTDVLKALGRRSAPVVALRKALRHYAAAALEHPARFKLISGRWENEPDELREAGQASYRQLVATVQAAQSAGELSGANPDRVAALLLAVAHGAADISSAGHLSPTGKGQADVNGLIDDLLGYLKPAVAKRRK
jgi:AcrR family transcriptional regulator